MASLRSMESQSSKGTLHRHLTAALTRWLFIQLDDKGYRFREAGEELL